MADPITLPDSAIKSLLAPIFQPGASLGQTQAQIPLTQQETATSSQSAATSAQEQQNLQAQNPGITAQSQTNVIQALQAKAQMGLQNDVHNNRMTLDDALNKYTALGMKPDDIFSKYLSESPRGMPIESPMQLMNKGITAPALGQIGQSGSFMDRFNTKNAIQGLRDLQGKFHQTSITSQIENTLGLPLGGGNAAAAYNTAKTVYGEHLSSLIPGGSSALSSVQGLANTLPDSGDPRNYDPGKADAKFSSLEDQLLKMKGYTPSDLGISSESATKSSTGTSGGSLLTNLVQKAHNNPADFLQQLNSVQRDVGVGGFNNAMATSLIGLVLGSFGRVLTGGGGEATEQAVSNLPGVLKRNVFSTKAIQQAGGVRTALVKAADKVVQPVTGKDLAGDIRSWADNAKLSNLPNADAIEQAALTAEKNYAGKIFKPSDLQGIYNGIEKGFTQKGLPRSSAESYIDRGIQSVVKSRLKQMVPGWQNVTSNMAKSYTAQGGPIQAGAKNLVKYGLLSAGAGSAGDVVNHFVFGK